MPTDDFNKSALPQSPLEQALAELTAAVDSLNLSLALGGDPKQAGSDAADAHRHYQAAMQNMQQCVAGEITKAPKRDNDVVLRFMKRGL